MDRVRRLPPMNALCGFEAAARLGSFTEAAQELCLTPGAISRQIRELEHYLGFDLFVRTTRRVDMTINGSEYYRSVLKVINELEVARNTILKLKERKSVKISALPTINALWLMPRLHEWSGFHQDIDIEVRTSAAPVDASQLDFDLGIRVGKVPGKTYDRDLPRIDKRIAVSWDGIQIDELFPDVMVPVCSPDVLPCRRRDVVGLLDYPLIHTTTRRNAWPDWVRAQGSRWPNDRREDLFFGHFFMCLDAARAGRGIALIPNVCLTGQSTMAGLCFPCTTAIESAGSYCLVTTEQAMAKPGVADMRKWLNDQAQLTYAAIDKAH
jgi:LysR family glycine cleavage system transcriptional activator